MTLPNPDHDFTGLDGGSMKGFDDHLDNYGDPGGPYPLADADEIADNLPPDEADPTAHQKVFTGKYCGKHGVLHDDLPPSKQEEEIEHITATVPLKVYRDGYGDVLLFDPSDRSYVVHVDRDGNVSTAYTVIEPPCNMIRLSQSQAEDFAGFEPGFTT